MRIWKIYTGLPVEGTYSYADLEAWEAFVAYVAGGYTLYHTTGAWVNTDNGLITEPSMVFEILDFDHHLDVHTLDIWRKDLAGILHQDLVLLTLQQGEVL